MKSIQKVTIIRYAVLELLNKSACASCISKAPIYLTTDVKSCDVYGSWLQMKQNNVLSHELEQLLEKRICWEH